MCFRVAMTIMKMAMFLEHCRNQPATPDTTPAVPSAPPAELDISVGDTAPFDYGEKLFSQLNELKTAFIDTSNQLCNTYSKTTINDI